MDSSSGAWVRLLLSTLKQEGCSKSAALVLAVIADKATENQSRTTWLRQSEIAARAGVDRRTVRRAVQQLRTLGLIETQQQQPGERLRYTLTAAVELPPKSTVATKAAAQRKRQQAAARAAEEEAEMQAYMACVNRFKEDDWS